MNPTEAAALGVEIADHAALLAAMDSHPVTNARMIEAHRRLALEAIEQLSAYLHLSDTFAPVQA
jgi:hypothetical protein